MLLLVGTVAALAHGRANDHDVAGHGRRCVDADLPGIEVDLLVVAFHHPIPEGDDKFRLDAHALRPWRRGRLQELAFLRREMRARIFLARFSYSAIQQDRVNAEGLRGKPHAAGLLHELHRIALIFARIV